MRALITERAPPPFRRAPRSRAHTQCPPAIPLYSRRELAFSLASQAPKILAHFFFAVLPLLKRAQAISLFCGDRKPPYTRDVLRSHLPISRLAFLHQFPHHPSTQGVELLRLAPSRNISSQRCS